MSGIDVEGCIAKANAYKDAGGVLFKEGDLDGALRKYHFANLCVKGLIVSTEVGSFSAMGSSEDKKMVKDTDKTPARDISGTCLNNISLIHMKKENFAKALEFAEQSCTVCPCMKSFYRRAVAHKALGDMLKAEEDFKTVLYYDENNAAAKSELQAIERAHQIKVQKQKQSLKKMFA